MGEVFIQMILRNQEMHLVDSLILGQKMMKIRKNIKAQKGQ